MIRALQCERRSVRRFRSTPIPKETLDEILDAGRLSPSGGNEQPWVFGVISDPGTIRAIADAAYGQEWIASAPLLLVLCTRTMAAVCGGRTIQEQRFPEFAARIAAMDNDLYAALNQEEHQTKIPGTVMALAAQEHGIGTTWVSRYIVSKVAQILHLPAPYLPAEILVLGYPDGEEPRMAKKALDQIVFYDRWDPQQGSDRFTELQLDTERLTLRPFTMDDLPAFHSLVSQPEVMAALPEDVMSWEEARSILTWSIESYLVNTRRRIRKLTLAVTLKTSGQVVGWVGLGPLECDPSRIELYYGLSVELWGQGLATEAARAMLAYGFQTLRLGQIVAAVSPENAASRRIVEKLGFSLRETLSAMPAAHRFYDGHLLYAKESRS